MHKVLILPYHTVISVSYSRYIWKERSYIKLAALCKNKQPLIDDPVIAMRAKLRSLALTFFGLLMKVIYIYYRAEGRVLVFEYVGGLFTADDEKELTEGVKTVASENTGCVFLLWIIKYLCIIIL